MLSQKKSRNRSAQRLSRRWIIECGCRMMRQRSAFASLMKHFLCAAKSRVNKRRLPRAGCHGKENIKRKQKRLPYRTVFSLAVNKLFADCAYWTCSCAASALDACVCVDLVLAFALCDCTYWALTLTCTTHNTLITNLVCHLFFLLGNNI